MAGRASSGRRGFTAGRIGADDNEDRWVPVGTVRTLLVDLVAPGVRVAGRVGFVSANVDCADSGRGGIFWGGMLLAAAALFCAAIVSLRLGR